MAANDQLVREQIEALANLASPSVVLLARIEPRGSQGETNLGLELFHTGLDGRRFGEVLDLLAQLQLGYLTVCEWVAKDSGQSAASIIQEVAARASTLKRGPSPNP
ncbi:hypothetical protein PHYC_03840 [Phycisphaerales bacterium]|nr:hypothetical protein PHYC_03840 [Phycisphaerales bacterium]